MWGKEHFISPGPLAWKHLFPFKSARDFCLPRKPKSCGGRSEKSRSWPGDFKRILACSQGPVPEGLWNCVPVLAPCQIPEKLSLPINFSVSFSHPCCEGVQGSQMRPTTVSFPPTLPLDPPPFSSGRVYLGGGGGSQSLGLWCG